MILFRYLGYFSPVLTLATACLSVLIVWNSTIYFSSGATPQFLLEKGELRENAVWMTAFYAHVATACVSLLVGFPLMFPAMLRFRKTHFVLGYIYLNCVLWVAAPTGLLIAPVAKGGFWGATGFLLTGGAWWLVTWLGYRSIVPSSSQLRAGKSPDVQTHIRWMIRSYSIALSAVVFRLIQIGLFYLGVEDTANYVASIWLSLAASFCISELCIRFASKLSKTTRQLSRTSTFSGNPTKQLSHVFRLYFLRSNL